jgi:hypothetical protein
VAVAVVISATALAQSKRNQSRIKQPPSQITNPESSKEQPQPQQPPIIVNVAPAPKTDAERAEEADERRNKSEIDANLADYTRELALFTKGLFYATTVLGIATIGLLIAAFFQSRDMKSSIAIADKAANAARKAAQIAEDALTKVERPYIFVIGVERFGIDQTSKVIVKFIAANYGKTPAVIEGVLGGVSVSKHGIPDPPPSSELMHDLMASPIIAAGGQTPELSVRITEIRTFAYNPRGQRTTVRLGEDDDIFFNMIICYRGAFSYGHESGACWRYDKTTARLVPYGGENYNYVK